MESNNTIGIESVEEQDGYKIRLLDKVGIGWIQAGIGTLEMLLKRINYQK